MLTLADIRKLTVKVALFVKQTSDTLSLLYRARLFEVNAIM